MTFLANPHLILQTSHAKTFKMKYTRCPYNDCIQKYLAAPSILPKSGGAIAPPAPPFTDASVICMVSIQERFLIKSGL